MLQSVNQKPLTADKCVYKWRIFAVVSGGVFMATMDSSMVNLALPAIMKDFGSPLKDTEWVSLIYLLVISSTLLIWGNLSDRLGRRLVYPMGLLVFALGSLSCAWSPDFDLLIMARLLQGLGAAMMMSTGPAIIKETFPPLELGRALGLIGTSVSLGLMTGPLVAGLALQFASWRAMFMLTFPIGLLLFFAARRYLPRHRPGKGRLLLAWPPALAWIILLTTASLTVTYAASPACSFTVLTILIVAVLLVLLGFIRLETSSPLPLLAPGLLVRRYMSSALLCAMLSFMQLFAVLIITPFYLDRVLDLPKIQIGLIMMSVPLAAMGLAPLAGWLYGRFSARVLCTIGLFTASCGAWMLSLVSPTGWLAVILPLTLIGGGQAIFLSPNSASVLRWIEKENTGKAAALLATGRNLGMIMGVGMASIAFSQVFSQLTNGLDMRDYSPVHAEAFVRAMHRVYQSAVLTGLLSVVISALRGKRRKN
ncbi:MFS transporter [Desulfobacterota bacterium M19]